ncbi:MAG: wax ester/triacylglycerol synthase family O-acyltransferase [Microthrixaceae bacterium]
MSALDAEFLHLEDSNSHMHIAGICTFANPAPSIQELETLVASKLHLLPRYRQRVRLVPLELGRPVWVDDPHFNIGYHIRHTALPAPGDAAALRHLMGRLMSQPLDRHRPLWEAWLTEGLDGDRWALICKVHHSMVDGIAGVGLLEMLLDLSPEVDVAEPKEWSAEPEPSVAAVIGDAWKGAIGDGVRMASRSISKIADPAAALRAAKDLGGGLIGLGQRLVNTPSSSIQGPVGPHRRWTYTTADLAVVKQIGRAHGATVNDVVLAAVTSGFRDLLTAHGDDPGIVVVRSLVPVSVRGSDGEGIADNRVSALLLELPVSAEDPLERLEAVKDAMSELKGSHMVEAADAVVNIGNLAPPVVLGAATRMAMRAQHFVSQRSIATVTTNVPGPQFPLYCLGREMLEYLPFVPIISGVRIGTAILSYNGALAFGITGDWDTASDVDTLAAGIDAAIVELASTI